MWKCKGIFATLIMLLFLQHYVVVSSPSVATTHLSPNMQKSVLFQFKLSLSIINDCGSVICEERKTPPAYPKTMNWSMSSNYCTWDGVTCDKTTGNVIRLDLGCSCLVGSIPPNSTLFQLSYLQSIKFPANDFKGILPEEIFHLPNLKEINVDRNSNLTIRLPKVKWGSSSSLQKLSLWGTTLSGGIPDSVGYLKSLNTLSLWNSNISGLIPEFIGNLTQLKKLDLSDNSFSGHIPNSFANLQNLTELFLDTNNLIGQFPSWLSNLRQLRYLDLSNNSLSGPLPSNPSGLCLPKLFLLDLSNNLLNGTIPPCVFNLPSVIRLTLDYNRFTGQLNEFQSPRLKSFSCSYNFLNGIIPQSLSELVNLDHLDLSSNNFSGVFDGKMLSHLRSLDISRNSLSLVDTNTTSINPNLEILGLSSCEIRKFPNFIRIFTNLLYLDLSDNQIDGEIPQWIGNSLLNLNLSHNLLSGGLQHLPWNSLVFLDLRSNLLNVSLPTSLCNSSSLKVLNLSHNNLTGVVPTCPGILNYNLSVFDLRMNSIMGSLPSTLSNFRKLKSLNMYGNKLEGAIPFSFAEFDHLEVLDLGRNHINGTFPQWLEALPNLQVLILNSNKFHGIINNVSKIERPFPKLRIIDLSENEFSGPLPRKYIENFEGMMDGDVNKMIWTYMGNSYYSDTIIIGIKGVKIEFTRILSVVTAIDLSRNKFEGEITEYIGNLESLRYLNLSHNYLTGHIPSSVGKLLMLESLDLSSNRLVGIIPQQLRDIYSLSHLNLSHNNLSGRIPEGAQFHTFQNDSFVGNFALCGHPLSKKCDREIIVTQEEEDDDDDDYFFSGFTWEAVVIGYGGGLVPGFVVGYMILMVGKPKWFMGTITRTLGHKVRSKLLSCGFTIARFRDLELGDKAILADWAWDCFRDGRIIDLLENDKDVLSEWEKAERFVMVGIWCIQEDPSPRPTMRKVIQMLEAVVHVPHPPCPSPFH